MKFVWVVYVSGVGRLVWETMSEAITDRNEWRLQGKYSIVYPKLITKDKLNNMKEFTGP